MKRMCFTERLYEYSYVDQAGMCLLLLFRLRIHYNLLILFNILRRRWSGIPINVAVPQSFKPQP